MNHQATVAGEPLEPTGGAVKFTWPSGSRPLDGYTIKRGVGRGGFGEVYYATSDAGKEVALKLIRRNLDVELRGVKQCLNLKHPNLVGLFDIRDDERGDSWVIMEFVRGESLEDVVRDHPDGLPVDEALWWYHDVCEGVAYLHNRGIVHRDLKPGNIFNDEGVVKIGDYGLSKFISASRRSGQTESVGTVHYMAPEIANGRYGKEIDIYALGVMLYELLTGHVPFEGESVGEVLMKHLTAEPDLQRLPEPHRRIVGKALLKDPGARYTSVRELMADLPSVGAAAHIPPPRRTTPPPVPPGAAPHARSPQARSPHAAPNGNGQPVDGPMGQPAPSLMDEEPVMRFLRGVGGRLSDAWQSAGFNPFIKVLLTIVLVVALMMSAPMWLFGVVVLGAVYLVYFFIWAMVRTPSTAQAHASPDQQPQPPPAREPGGSPSPPPPRRAEHHLRRSHRLAQHPPRPVFPKKSPRQKFTELLGSLLLSAVVVLALCVMITVLWTGIDSPQSAEQFAWLAIVGIAGTWGVLIPSKFWEGSPGEPILRRFVLLCVGLGLGFFGYAVAEALMVHLPTTLQVGPHPSQAPDSLFDSAGAPTLVGYLAYFGFLFPILRWWRQADPLRWTRFSIWATAVCVFWAALLNLAWPFPQPWGMILAGVIAMSVQLSSPWFDPNRQLAQHGA